MSDLAEKMNDEPRCVSGCKAFYGGELQHHADCPFYPESLTKLRADEKSEQAARLEALEAAICKIHGLNDNPSGFNAHIEAVIKSVMPDVNSSLYRSLAASLLEAK